MIHQLVYVSKAVTGPRTEEEIENILSESRKRNEANGITGVLLFRGTTFLQLLEGPAAAVKDALARIERDPRHRNLTLLVDQPAGDRLYGECSLSYRNLDDSDAHLVNELLGWSNLILRPGSVDASRIVDLIGRFRTAEATV